MGTENIEIGFVSTKEEDKEEWEVYNPDVGDLVLYEKEKAIITGTSTTDFKRYTLQIVTESVFKRLDSNNNLERVSQKVELRDIQPVKRLADTLPLIKNEITLEEIFEIFIIEEQWEVKPLIFFL